MKTRTAVALALVGSAVLAARPASAQADADFADAILGTWTGEGMVTGAEVTLDRVWTAELGGSFLRAEMVVHMANDFSFGALTYWRQSPTEAWDIHWMDEAGQTREFRGTWDRATRTLTTHYLEDTADEAPGWRRIRYRIVDGDHYDELLDVETSDGWTRIGEFRFTRTGGPGASSGGGAADPALDASLSTTAVEIAEATRAFRAAQEALDGEAAAAFLAPEFYMYVDGVRLSYDEVAAGIRSTMASLRSLESDWTALEIRALGPDAGFATFRFRDTTVDAYGEMSVAAGPTTLVWARRDGAWRIVYADADHYPPD